MANVRKPGRKDIKTGERDLEKSIVGKRGIEAIEGTKDIITGIKKDRKSKRRGK